MSDREETLRENILHAVRQYVRCVHGDGAERDGDENAPVERVSYAGRVFDEKEVCNLVESALDFWLTSGRFTEQFERGLCEFLGARFCSLVNSGSSANLLAVAALSSPKLEDRAIRPGDEVITVAAAFPTTVAPILQQGAVPVFVDISLPSYNIDCTQLEKALSPKSKAVMLAHTLGNPFPLAKVKEFCETHRLWLIEDNCDALGSRYCMNGCWKYTGSFGDLGTSSFFPAHHITTGEGGAVYTDDPLLKQIVDSFRDWGRDCWCSPGKDDTCKHRFTRQFGQLPLGYDHKYVFSHFGYNLKATEMQAAIGCAQLEKLASFTESRKKNWLRLHRDLEDMDRFFVLPEPESDSDPSWFGFLLTVREGVGFSRNEIVQHLERRGIQTRMLFAGNLLKHPCFDEMRRRGDGFRVVGDLSQTDRVLHDAFWIGVYPGMNERKIDYMLESIRGFCSGK